MEESNSPNKAIIAIVVVVLLLFAAGATMVLTSKPSTQDSSAEVASDLPLESSSEETSTASSNAEVKDGTYSATGSYRTPGGAERIGVEVTIADGIVSEVDLTEMGQSGESQEYQSRFASGYKSQVVGKKISEIKLDRVAGSSLTSGGFNDAINDIAKQAQA